MIVKGGYGELAISAANTCHILQPTNHRYPAVSNNCVVLASSNWKFGTLNLGAPIILILLTSNFGCFSSFMGNGEEKT